jgi:hypothetical protein
MMLEIKLLKKIQNLFNRHKLELKNMLNNFQVLIIYTQYIDGGIVPLALALEELGFGRYSSSANAKNLFAGQRTEPLDALTMKPRSKLEEGAEFHQAKYVMITGDKAFSPNNAADIKQLTNPENKYGKDIDANFSFEDSDIKTVTDVSCIEQVLDILTHLRKGDNQFFPQDGIESDLLFTNNNI